MKISGEMPDDVWFAFVAKADKNGQTTGQRIARLILDDLYGEDVDARRHAITNGTGDLDSQTVRVLQYHQAGLTIPLIAATLDVPNNIVQQKLYGLGLRGNKPTAATRSLEGQIRGARRAG